MNPATSFDTDYDELDPSDVSVTNNDNETPGFTIYPATNWSNYLPTSEGGIEATFSVVLNSTPSADVTLPLSVSDASEASINKISLTYTFNNWNAPQTVVVSGMDDLIADGNVYYTVNTGTSTSTDSNYNGINPVNIVLRNLDNEQAGVTFDPVRNFFAPFITTEGGGQVIYTMALNSPPTSDVVIDLNSNDASEGTVSPSVITFTIANWNIPQTVTVWGVDDGIVDGNINYRISATSTSIDPDYNNLTIADVYMQNTDDETAGFLIDPDTFWFDTLTTNEFSGQDFFTIVLTKAPSTDVTLTLYSSDISEGFPNTTTLVFTPLNWDAPQQVIVTGVDDGIADGNRFYEIRFDTAYSLDPDYNGLQPNHVYCINVDND